MKNIIENMSKNTKLSIGAIVLVIIIALIVRFGGHKKDTVTELIPEVPNVEEQMTGTTSKNRVSKSEVVDTAVEPADTRSYSELIVAFKGQTLQFGKSCQVLMSDQVYKLGAHMLIDNRNDVPVSINIGPSTYELGSYGYKVISLNNEGKFMVSCGDYKNVATVTVQQ
jgi:hypothetical protein